MPYMDSTLVLSISIKPDHKGSLGFAQNRANNNFIANILSPLQSPLYLFLGGGGGSMLSTIISSILLSELCSKSLFNFREYRKKVVLGATCEIK